VLTGYNSQTSSSLFLWEIDTPPSSQQQRRRHQAKDRPREDASTLQLPEDADADCPFRDSPLHRKVYVYPNPGEEGWEGDILSEAGRNLVSLKPWPWLAFDKAAKASSTGHYNIYSQNVQYTTELLVREIMINPASCLRTSDPEEASLFYVPYLPSMEYHMGQDRATDYSYSPYGRAITDILDDRKYGAWEELYGLTSKYWKRREGADHILVFSEPMHGLYHPRNRRGNFHFIHSQKQLTPPIVISVELSTSFVEMYPACAAKNILMPYPNTDGRWFNGVLDKEASTVLEQKRASVATSGAAAAAERTLLEATTDDDPILSPRPVAQFYNAGNHGTCRQLRRAMKQDYEACSPSAPVMMKQLGAKHYATGMRVATFCPCPGGDSPSAKRMFDALLAGCIPVILSHDFVWPFTKEFDPLISLDPADFSIRLNATDYDEPLLEPATCQPKDASKPGLQAFLDSISPTELERLRRGAAKARDLYSWYKRRPGLPENPLQEGVLPDGGTAVWLVQALAERAEGRRWPACEKELTKPRGKDPMQFKC
jgi:hypothetical protein